MSWHIAPASETSGRTDIVFQTKSVDRVRRRVMIVVPVYNAILIFTNTSSGVKIISETDRQTIDENQPATTHVPQGVYKSIARVAASILSQPR